MLTGHGTNLRQNFAADFFACLHFPDGMFLIKVNAFKINKLKGNIIMAFSRNTPYYMISHAGTGKCLNVYGNEQVSPNRNVCLWTKGPGKAQSWSIVAFGGNDKIVSGLSQTYALNYYWSAGSGNPGNCDIYLHAENDKDSCVTLIPVNEDNRIYKIKLKNYDLYLTAKGGYDNADVRWEAHDSTVTSQQWQLVQFSSDVPTTATSLKMPQNVNQRHTQNDQVIRDAGCAVCCACDVASFYRGAKYSLADMRNHRVYTTANVTCQWVNVPSAGFRTWDDTSDQAGHLRTIRSEISSGRPVLVYMQGTYQHWVVAYGYTGAGTSTSEIKVLDPYGISVNASTGQDWTLQQALEGQGAYKIHATKCTYKK